MALSSAGVEVTVINESFYTPAAPGTVPMIFVVSAQDKANPAGTGTAQGTLKANAGVPYLLTSQRDLAETFGDPIFQTDSGNNPVNAGELNEYGLQAAYSLLGVSNRAWVVRADIDTGALEANATEPAGPPADGTYWFDTQNTTLGVFEWNGNPVSVTGGQSFDLQPINVITNAAQAAGGTPNGSVGAIGSYALVSTSSLNKLYYKNGAGAWVEVGSSAWIASHPTIRNVGGTPTSANGGTFDINSTTITIAASDALADIVAAINAPAIAGVTAAAVNNALEVYSTGVSLDITNGTNTVLADIGIAAAEYFAPALNVGPHTSVPAFKTADQETRPSGSVWVKTTEPNAGARWRVNVYNADTQLFDAVEAPLYATGQTALFNLDRAGGGLNVAVGDTFVKYNDAEAASPIANFKIYRRASTGPTIIRSAIITDAAVSSGFDVNIQESIVGSATLTAARSVTATTGSGTAATDAENIATAINAAGFTNITASVDASNRVVIQHGAGGEIRIDDDDGYFTEMGFVVYNSNTNAGTLNFYTAPAGDTANEFVVSNWSELSVESGADAPTALTEQDTLWYSSVIDEVDIMIHTGITWDGYLNEVPGTNATGPMVSASRPTTQSDGVSALVTGDLWIDTSDIENFPTIYKWNDNSKKFDLVDSSDQTSEDGIIFADARYDSAGINSLGEAASIEALLGSDYVDFDAPDPALYPKGMMLWNLRRSGFNVKRFELNYVDVNADNIRYNNGEEMTNYYPHRWVTESANQADGSGTFGRKAQRKVVVQALQALLNSNDAIRDNESRLFNLMATPGYPELIGEMISLNFDRDLSAFIIGDSPARLTPDATSLNNWGTNVNLVAEDNDLGLVSRDEYMGIYYPWGFSSDNAGNNVVVPPSHMMLRTIALSDQVSYPWFAPAGTRRGGITNASAAGYVSSEGEFVVTSLNEGQRDTMFSIDVNPITFITGAGLVAFSQNTRARNNSSLDRINVARLVVYLRSQLNRLAKPYMFEPNDQITRNELKQAAESLMLELVGQRGIYDFLVVCDSTNNTPARIDRSELYLDIAIEPVKAVEFIYIPLRLKNTGEIAGLG